MKKLILTGGGSAGHAVPNAALIPALAKKYDLAYIGSGGIEREIVAPFGIPFIKIGCVKFVRGALFQNFAIPFRLAESIRQARRALETLKADGVFSKGGYVALPVVYAAAKLGIPALTHESDLTPGLANTLIAKKCRAVLTAFPETAEYFKNGIYAGAPVRSRLFGKDKVAALAKYGFTGKKPVLLALGGGSGSTALNGALRAALPAMLPHFDILHLCGKGKESPSSAGYVCVGFEQDMASAYAAADLALSRAGAGAAFELLALQKPALFIPLENRRSRGDQVKNAEYFRARGLAHLLREQDLTPETLAAALLRLQNDPHIRGALASRAPAAGNERILSEIDALMQS